MTLTGLQPDSMQPRATAGMEQINRYWDQLSQKWVAKILPGELYVSAHSELVITVLGSCVAACIRDTNTGVGGMNHFMLPQETANGSLRFKVLKTRYGHWAMEALINEILKSGGRKDNLEVKLFGGANVVSYLKSDVGGRNISFVHEYLENESISIAAEDTGGSLARKIIYNPASGKCRVKSLSSTKNQTIERRENDYRQKVSSSDNAGSIELF